MFKILKRNVCGLDVHKTWVYACIGITDSHDITQYFQERFSTFVDGLEKLVLWLKQHDCCDVCMESSGKYWIPVHNILEAYDIKTCVAHPKYTKPVKGNKTDRKDAKWICDLYACGMVKGSFIPPLDIRSLRELTRYRAKLQNNKTSEKNRVLNCLTVSNMKLDDVFSDVFGKSGSSIVRYIIDHPGEKFDVAPFVNKQCKKPIADIQKAVEGAISKQTAELMRIHMDHIAELEDHIDQLDKKIALLTASHSQSLALLGTVPGISADSITAKTILAEIGDDMSVFPTAKHLVSYCGCCPRNDQSANKVKCNHISHAGTYLKPVLFQTANAIIRSAKYPEIKRLFGRVKARHGHKKAIIAVCNMLLTAIWHVLSKKTPYNPAGYLTGEPIKSQVKQTISREEAVQLLSRMGFEIQNT